MIQITCDQADCTKSEKMLLIGNISRPIYFPPNGWAVEMDGKHKCPEHLILEDIVPTANGWECMHLARVTLPDGSIRCTRCQEPCGVAP